MEFREINNGVTWTNLLVQNTFYGHEYLGVLTIAPTNVSLNDTYTFKLVDGFLPKTVAPVIEDFRSGSLDISGTPTISLFDGRVYEYSYPYDEPTTDRYYFTIKATGLSTSGTKAFYIDFRKDWCDIRDEFISKVENQSFAIDRQPVPNVQFLEYKKEIGDYICPD